MAKSDLVVVHDPKGFDHDTGPGHPERVERLRTVMDVVTRLGLRVVSPSERGWSDGDRLRRAIEAVHSSAYIERLHAACATGRRYIDAVDSVIGPKSFEAALASAACALAAAEVVVNSTSNGGPKRAFVAMRPPGHHCEADRSMGFCLFNNIAIAAQWLIAEAGLTRVVIVDFDVHHGNGTQHFFESRADVLYISTHQHPSTMYPGTGFEWETGQARTPGAGFTLNVPLMPGTGDREVIDAFDRLIIPRLDEYRPEVLLISAGFDADARDPLANLEWTTAAYSALTSRLCGVANRWSGGRIVSLLEGGYDLTALAEGVGAHLEALARD